MKILVIGGGGREHALVWKLRQSPRVTQIWCAPGNAGIAQLAECVAIKITDIPALVAFAQEQQIDFTVVGPDDALAAGIVDAFEAAGLRAFGPLQAAARLESSKVFSKAFMAKHGIPTARGASFSDPADARSYSASLPLPQVIKADGLALGKGVVIAQTREEAEMAIVESMERGRFGDAGKSVVIEEFLIGRECSMHALVDGRSYLLFPLAQDHKQVFDGGEGPNTGGMGTCSPQAFPISPAVQEQIRTEVMDRFMAGIQADGIDFRGMLFPGLMITADGLRVLEFNCRFGDPETQVLLPLLESDLLTLLEATAAGTLASVSASFLAHNAVCVVMASGGYPGSYRTGLPITGLDAVPTGTTVFHAGTRLQEGQVVTAGGRVLGVTCTADSPYAARTLAYQAVSCIHFEGEQHRTDIGAVR